MVWLIGHSRGTTSAATAAARLTPPEGPYGIVLMSPVVISGNKGKDSFYDTNLKNIKIPTLIYSHKSDSCYETEWSDTKNLEIKLTASTDVETIRVTVENSGKYGQECKSNSHHGFKGMRKDAIEQVIDWIKSK